MTESVRDIALRPRSFVEFIGQRDVITNHRIAVDAARRTGRGLDHTLLTGRGGLGKSSIALLIASELGAQVHITSAPAIEHKGELASLSTSLDEGDVLFIDEIHRLSPELQECLYPALEDLRFDLFASGSRARAITLRLPPFTLVAATTRPALLAAPFLDRFGLRLNLGQYDTNDMIAIVRRSSHRLGITIETKWVCSVTVDRSLCACYQTGTSPGVLAQLGER